MQTDAAPNTFMRAEILETPDAVARLVERESGTFATLGRKLRGIDPRVVVTAARGSSDNAAAYFKYLVEILLGVPVASVGPSVASVYRAPLRLRDALVISVSQSGQSPDIVALQQAAREAGAFSIAVCNQPASPLASAADVTIPLHAGPEQSVAATKTCLGSAVALASLVAEWKDDDQLRRTIMRLPESLHRTLACEWSEALPVFTAATSAYVVGRGPALPVAAEAALKFKETAVLHAEAFSGAEVMHGPLQLLQPRFPVLAFLQDDAAKPGMVETVARLRAAQGHVFAVGAGQNGTGALPCVATGHAALDPLAMLLAFYGFAEQIARARGHDPDRPSLLRKVTETV
ncbi:SIS domain-containing protein [Lichenihabitans sp. Uapishka_5]|uniref:SIS domain-containing protein n=1 Tax=Lichenihabitans sp. Uapishka_5 TaxID=3037302 RepID=UPI0029E819EB|nr:SIS domain-containing protein [Lichenihabitans sp. Uapishka_5]MDX7949868.1 SIS domain-containing protein [Lichenihabitans sp. Uapishka_5]